MCQQALNYQRIAKAIQYIKENFKQQPSLQTIASTVNLSPFHFQRIFTDWAGVSPKKFMQYLSVAYAKQLLRDEQDTVLEASVKTGFSSTSRLHELFVSIEGMSPGEFKNGGKQLTINYSFAESPFGQIIIASTKKGICHIAFTDHEHKAVIELKKSFPNACHQPVSDKHQENVLAIFEQDWRNLKQIKLHLTATPFQLKVWQSLLTIPLGSLSSYGRIAHTIGHPNAARAVGTAIASNPVAFLIPCHRVIQANGNSGEYRWNRIRKTAIIGWEAARINKE